MSTLVTSKIRDLQTGSEVDVADIGKGYKGLWPEAGGSATKGETWQTQVDGVPTGEYFTALQNTSINPVSDNVNWSAINLASSISGLMEMRKDLIGSEVYPPEPERSLKIGDELDSSDFVRTNFGLFEKDKPLTGTVEHFAKHKLRLSGEDMYLLSKTKDEPTVDSFGAIGDGQSHPLSEFFNTLEDAQFVYPHAVSLDDEIDWAASQALIDSGKKFVLFRVTGRYAFNRALKYDTQTTFYSPCVGISHPHGRSCVVTISRETWSGEDAIFTKRNRAAQYQSIVVKGVSFRGYANISWSSLHTAEDIGVSAIDISAIKDGAVIKECSFRKVGTVIKKIGTEGYLGFVEISSCHFIECYSAYDGANTTGVLLKDCRVYDCYDWVTAGTLLTLVNTAFNNSTLSSELCGVRARSIFVHGGWFEGGNNWFDFSDRGGVENPCTLVVDGAAFSEAMSGHGSTKVIIRPPVQGLLHVTMTGVRQPTNTRWFGIQGTDIWGNITLKMSGCRHISRGWSLETNALGDFIAKGLKFSGEGNVSRDEANYPEINQDFSDRLVQTQGVVYGQKIMGAGGAVFRVTTNLRRRGAPTFNRTVVGYTSIVCMGQNDGAGGGSLYYLKVYVMKGQGSVWSINTSPNNTNSPVTSLSENGFTVSLSEESAGSCKLTVVPTHSGSKSDTSYSIAEGSAGLTITQEEEE